MKMVEATCSGLKSISVAPEMEPEPQSDSDTVLNPKITEHHRWTLSLLWDQLAAAENSVARLDERIAWPAPPSSYYGQTYSGVRVNPRRICEVPVQLPPLSAKTSPRNAGENCFVKVYFEYPARPFQMVRCHS
jgi:hypothetical protein